MSDLVQDGETIRRIVARLSTAIDELARSKSQIIQVEASSFGSSSRGAQTHRQVDRAYDAIQDTLTMLQATHDDFAAQLEQVDRKLKAIDEEAAADAKRAQSTLDSAGGAA